MSAKRLHTIIEAGVAGWPSVGVPGRRPLTDGQQYIGLGLFESSEPHITSPDRKAKDTKLFMDILNASEPGTRHIVRGDATRMPFGTHTADEVIAVNLFGDPRFENLERGASEIARVLRPLGSLTVVETISPQILPVSDLSRTLGRFGLSQTNAGYEHDHTVLGQYYDPSSGGYVATFSPDGSVGLK